jgi:hypothetical protein
VSCDSLKEMDEKALLVGLYIFGLLVLLALVIFEYPDYRKYREELKRKSSKK